MPKDSWNILMVVLSSVNPDVRVEKEARFLALSGHSVTILCIDPTDGDLPFSEYREGFQIIRVPSRKKLFFKYFEFWKQALKYIKSQSYDIIHFHDLNVLPIASKVSPYTRAIIYDAHENFPEQMSETYGIIAYWVYTMLERHYIKFADEIITVGITCANNIKRKYKRDSHCIANYPSRIDIDQAHSLEIPETYRKKTKLRVIYFGVMYNNLGYDKIVEAAELLSQKFSPKDIEFMIIGDGPAYEPMKNLIAKNGLGEYCNLTGWMDYHQALSIMRAGDIGLILFQPGKNNYLRIPNRLYEYCSAGLAFVASDFEGIRLGTEYERPFGLYIDATSPVEIATAIEKLYNDHETLEQMKQTAREAYEKKYNWETEVSKLIQIYKSALKNK